MSVARDKEPMRLAITDWADWWTACWHDGHDDRAIYEAVNEHEPNRVMSIMGLASTSE